MKTLLTLLLLIPSLSWSDIIDIKFPFKIYCEIKIPGTNNWEYLYRILEGNSMDEVYFYEVSTQQNIYEDRFKTKLVVYFHDKDFIQLSEKLNNWENNEHIDTMIVNRKTVKIDYGHVYNKPNRKSLDCRAIDSNINSDNYLKKLFDEFLKEDVKDNLI